MLITCYVGYDKAIPIINKASPNIPSEDEEEIQSQAIPKAMAKALPKKYVN